MKRTQTLLAALLILVASSWLYSSITLTGAGSTVIAPPALRQGDYLSPDAIVPVSGITTATAQFDIPNTSEYETATNAITFAVEMSADGATDWRPTGGFTWVGGRYVDKTGAVDPSPSVTFDLRPWTAQGLTHVRAHVSIPNAMTAGVTVTLQ